MRVPVRHSRESSQGLQAAVPPALPTGIRHLGSPTRMHCRLPPRPMASNAADHAVGKKAPSARHKAIAVQISVSKVEKPPSLAGAEALCSRFSPVLPCPGTQSSISACPRLSQAPEETRRLPCPHHLPPEVQPPDPDVRGSAKLNPCNRFTHETQRAGLSATRPCRGPL